MQSKFHTRLNYIKEILTYEQCVVIPGVGGFITDYLPARISTNQSLISPPWKSVAFNIRLINNDGILSAYFRKKENISSDVANIEVAKFASEIKNKLKNNETILFPGLGSLTFINNESPLFKPLDKPEICKESFGLKTITAHPAFAKENKIEKKQSEKVFTGQNTENANRKAKRKSRNPRRFIFLSALLILFSLMYFKVGVEHLNLQQFGFSFPTTWQPDLNKALQESVKEIQNEESIQISNEDLPEPEDRLNHHQTYFEDYNEGYFIILASFQSKNRAERYLNQMKKDFNLDFQIIPHEHFDFFRVGYYSGKDYLQSETELNDFTKKGIEGAWLIYNKTDEHAS
ncbi:MAG: hypothetical protein EA412_13825 [Chitinophagaceae bacterium]|nr:MAG: hypothetical protein EA412_13825 [Chitinophagaceae bacterium]